MRKICKLITILAILITAILVISGISQATSESIILSVPEKSKEFEKWENLSEKERENTIQPSYSSISLKESVKKSTYNSMLLNRLGSSLAPSYQITGLTLKDQQSTELCWAFSFSSVLESSGKGKIYSPAYLDYMVLNKFNKSQGAGANFYLALAASANGSYPVLESKMPFESVYNTTKNSSSTYYLTPIDQLTEDDLNQTIDARIINATNFAGIYKEIGEDGTITYTDGTNEYTTDSDNNGIPDEVETIRNLIKEHIKENGAITAAMYSDLIVSSDGTLTSSNGFFNPATGATFCNDADKVANHAVTIVGWDDDYGVDYFNSDVKPTNPGAYIVLNSYGDMLGNNGYIYVSYEDVHIEQMWLGIDELEEYETSEEMTYDNIYQYDELGVSTAMSIESPNITPMAANVFSRDSSKEEYINEVGVFLWSTEGVQIYINAEDDTKTNLQQVSVETENITPGYHIIKLSSPIKLTGEKFVVAVRYINKEDGTTIPIESNLKESGFVSNSNYWDTAKANEGESFISLDNGTTWQEINNIELSSTITLKNTNACIKAYTTEVQQTTTISVESVTLDKQEATIKVGETQSLIATVLPENATNKNVTWESSNSSVATVSGGVVTGVSEGTAEITVTTIDGGHTATCQITVEEIEKVEDEQPTTVSVTGVSLDKQETTIKVGETQSLIATVLPENATNKNVTWASSNSDIATVNGGVVTGISEGTAEITVTTVDGSYTATCTITVEKIIQSGTAVTKVTLNKNTLELEVGDQSNLVATIIPTNATNKAVKWTSSNTTVATISDTGIIKALKQGTTTITVTTEDGGFTDTCTVTVSEKTSTDDDIYNDDTNNNTTDKKPTEENNINTSNTSTTASVLPYTGIKGILMIFVITSSMILAVSYIRYRKLKDIK